MWISYVNASLLVTVVGLTMAVSAQQISEQSATLFSRNKYRTERLKNCITFREEAQNGAPTRPCDVTYGNLWAGDELDWFNGSGEQGDRSVIKDLGSYKWSDRFVVPVVAAQAKLKPGERRTVSVDVSGADGADGRPGARGADGASGADGSPGANADGSVPRTTSSSAPRPVELGEPVPKTPPPPKRDGKHKIDPFFVKAVVGHMYVIHVVDADHDFYALFRVDRLVYGDRCVVSWKLIDAPAESPK